MNFLSTLRQYLTRSDPNNLALVHMDTHAIASWPEIDGNNLTRWEAFQMQALNEQFGSTLDHLDRSIPAPAPRLDDFVGSVAQHTPSYERNLLSALGKWCEATAAPAVQLAMQRCYPNRGDAQLIWLSALPNDIQRRSLLPPKIQQCHVDFFLRLVDHDFSALVVGLCQPADNISTFNLEHGNLIRGGKLLPVRRLAYLCESTGTPFGFICTESEVIVFQFTNTPSDSILYRGVSQTQFGSAGLTPQLAIWWLCMQAIQTRLGPPSNLHYH